jgi:hypothetical protein
MYILRSVVIVILYTIGLLSFILLKPYKVLEYYDDEIKGAQMVSTFSMTEIYRKKIKYV